MSCKPLYYISAYAEAVAAGFEGTREEWLESLKGEGTPGKSAYEYAVEAGFQGTEEEFAQKLARDGKSAYEYAVEAGYTGTEQAFAKSLATIISSINGVTANSAGLATLTPKDINAQPAGEYATKKQNDEKLDKSGGTVTGDLNVNGQATVQDPTEPRSAVNMKYVRETIKASTRTERVTLTKAGWSGKRQTVKVAGIQPGTDGKAGPAGTEVNVLAWVDAQIYIAEQRAGELVFACVEEPAGEIQADVIFWEVPE